MKNKILIWCFIAGVIITVFVAFNYQGKQNTISLNEIFPEEEDYDKDVQFEFIGAENQKEGGAEVVTIEENANIPPTKVFGPQAVKTQTSGDEVKETKAAVITKKQPEVSRPSEKSLPLPAQPLVNVSDSKYTIQAASMKSKVKAEEEVAKCKKMGFDAFSQMRDLGEKGVWYRVYIGQFSSKAAAEKELPKVKSSYPNSFIISPKK